MLSRDTELLGQMQCYCRILYSSREYKTEAQEGKNPVWNCRYLLSLVPSTPLAYEVFDQETVGKDDEVGKGAVDLEKYLQRGEIIGPLYYKEQSSGTVFFSVVPVPLQYVLVITHVRAELHEDSDWVGKIDPFVELEINGKFFYRTTVLEERGQNPEW